MSVWWWLIYDQAVITSSSEDIMVMSVKCSNWHDMATLIGILVVNLHNTIGVNLAGIATGGPISHKFTAAIVYLGVVSW